ncbi:hypothetical protein [Paraburkholderia sp.]|uniref:hypothetical protein n=1 Tax=Paraburkholderia sp. TaxID=1926495 RepID=UPI002D2C2481|nr:hypothetical protein [Paraburkholderia sp.]HZZ04467.1 hypothetical protein [Paraburkholderia sp.]
MAGNLGFSTYLAADCCFTFDRQDCNGNLRSAEDVHAMSLANLDHEYYSVITAEALLDVAEVHRDFTASFLRVWCERRRHVCGLNPCRTKTVGVIVSR